MQQEKIIKKIPGEVQPSKKNSQGYIDTLENKSMIELRDILERQNKLLANRSFILKLPDRGDKIIKFRDKIQNEIADRDEVEKAASLFSRLNIVSEGKDAMNQLEWTGKCDDKASSQIVELDVDDETDPLKILAQPTGSGVHKKRIIQLPAEESLIKPEDLMEIEEMKKENTPVFEHVKYIIDIVEKPGDKERPTKQKYMPYKTTLSNVHDPMKEKLRKKHNHWENTAATPPLIVHGAAKILSLNESLKLQIEQSEKLKEIQTKYAIEQLTQNINVHNIGAIQLDMNSYRIADHDTNASNSEEEEVHDDDDDKIGTVVFPVNS